MKFSALRALRSALCLFGAAACVATQAHAQGVDPRGDWRTLATPHFRVHFRSALEEQGRRAAADAETAWALLAAELHPPRGPIDLVVADNADVSNGYATPIPTPRVVVYAQPPIDASSLRFYDDWLQLVTTHELTHIFHLDRSRGVWRVLQRVFGRNPALFPNQYGPSWLTEGLAVYFESKLTGAGRLLGTEHRLIARAAAADAELPRLDQLSLAGSVYPLGERAYAYGSLLVDYIARRGGRDDVRRFVDRQSAQLIPWRLDHAARRSFGLSFSDAWRSWRDSVVRSVGALPPSDVAGTPLGGAAARDTSRAMGAWRELTRSGWFVEAPRWLGGRTVVYGANDGRSVPAAERVDVDGGRRRLGRRNSLSPNVPLSGGSLLFAQLDFSDRFTIRSDLYLQSDTSRVVDFGAASAGQRRLTYGARLSHPDARADGAIVAVQSGGGTTWLVRVSADGRTIVPLTAASPDTQWTEPRWSPDGRRVFWSSDRTGAPQLYVASLDEAGASPPTRLSGVTTGLVEPALAPNGGTLAALLFRVDGYHVAVADTARLTPTANAEPSHYPQTSAVAAAPPRAEGPTSGYSPWRTLWPRYWTPVLGASDGGSVVVGAATTGNDVLVRHAYAAQATVNTLTGDVEGGASYRYARLGNPLVDVDASQAWQYDTVGFRQSNGTVAPFPLFRRARSAGLALSFARPRIRNSASLSLGGAYERREYTSPNASLRTAAEQRLGTAFPSVFVSAGWANTRRPARSISPEDGVSLSATVQQRWQNGRLGPQSRRATGVARLYKSLDLPGFAHHVLALRAAGGAADDRAATELTAGGVSGTSAELLPGVTFGNPPRTFGVRGFSPSTQQGLRAAAGSVEYRAPLALPARGARLLPVFADRLSISFFGDAGSAWCPAGVNRQTQLLCLADLRRSPSGARWLASAGAEVALDAALSYDVPYRFRLGAAAPLTERDLAPNPVGVYVTLGLAF